MKIPIIDETQRGLNYFRMELEDRSRHEGKKNMTMNGRDQNDSMETMMLVVVLYARAIMK